MALFDTIRSVLVHVTDRVFADSVLITYSNATTQTVRATFFDKYESQDVDGDVIVDVTTPAIEVCLAFLTRELRAKDKVRVKGIDYYVRDSHRDSEGICTVRLGEYD